MASKPNPIAFWLKNARPIAIPQSVLPAILALLLAFTFGDVFADERLIPLGYRAHATLYPLNFGLGIYAIIGVAIAHLTMNLIDDYFDWKVLQKSEANGSDAMSKRRPSKCNYLADNSTTIKQFRRAIFIFLCFALLDAGLIFYYRGVAILILLAILLILGIFYSAPPLKLSYRGLGEVVIGILMGPALMSGVIISATGVLPLPTLLITVATGLLVTVILYVHSMLDIAADRAADKTTLAGLLKSDKSRMLMLVLLLLTPYILLLIALILQYLPPSFVLMFLTVPISAQLLRSMNEYYRLGVEAPSQPRAWQGPFGSKQRWQAFTDRGLAWFMYRWLLARNNLMIFCLLGILSSMLNVLLSYL